MKIILIYILYILLIFEFNFQQKQKTFSVSCLEALKASKNKETQIWFSKKTEHINLKLGLFETFTTWGICSWFK